MQPTPWTIVGSLGASLYWWHGWASQQSQQLLIIISATSAVLAWPGCPGSESSKGKSGVALAIFLITGRSFTVLLARRVPELPARLGEYGRFAPMRGAQNKTIYVGEGLTASCCFYLPTHPELSQRRQGPGFKRSGGHEAAANARTSDNIAAENPNRSLSLGAVRV